MRSVGSLKRIMPPQSMSRPGKCIDNGPMENVWGIIKSEKYYLNIYYTVEALKKDINDYIKFYNTQLSVSHWRWA